jgi:hypothetical protein
MSTNYLIRLQPRTRSSELEHGVAARVYDPAWLLGRQWQIGELLGEDGGSPVRVRLDAETAKLSHYAPASRKTRVPFDPRGLPLEALVEAEARRAVKGWTARMRVDAGRALVRTLRESQLARYVPAFGQRYRVDRASAADRTIDPGGARLLDVAAGRLPDGEQLYGAVVEARAEGRVPDEPVIALQDVDAVTKALTDWLAWCESSLTEGTGTAWIPERFEHRFEVATGTSQGATVLEAAGYRGGRLDWHSFDARPVASATGFTALAPIDSIPTGVRFRGMPAARWWEFEDASTDPGSIEAGASDAARLALLEFMLVYGNDYFAVPLRLSVGSLTRINALTVTDTFGMTLEVGPASHGSARAGANRWTMFTLTETNASIGSTGVADLFFLPPTVGQILTSDAVEEVLLLRDEMANLAWGVERRYEGGTGLGTSRLEEVIRAAQEPPPPADIDALRYVLGTSVPEYWFPLVPVSRNDQLLLDLQRMADHPTTAAPRGRFLDLGGPDIPDEEVPREGARLLRDYVRARWVGGSTLVWSRRRKQVGRGEGSSGLRFDVAEGGSSPEP